MQKKQPSDYKPQLIKARLDIIASALLDVYDEVQRELATELDSNYTRGTTTFGRQKNKIILMCLSKKYDWLDLRNTSNDLTFAIGGIPFRFFRDDHEKPKKRSFWRLNVQDNLSLFETSNDVPVYWRFVVERPLTEEGEAAVYVIGANSNQEIVCEWKYDEAVRVLKSVDSTRPEAVDTPEPEVGVPKNDQNQERNVDPGSGM